MSANCKFSNKYLPLVLRQHQNLSHDPNYIEGEFVDWMKDTFTDAEEILNKIKEGNGDWVSLRRPAPTSILTKEKVPTFSRNIISTPEIKPSVDQLYVGRADLRLSMEQRFAEDIVKLTVFNLDANDGQGQFVTFDAPGDNGISTGNQNILNYKNSLLKAMTDEMYGTGNNTVTLTADMSAQEFDGTINKVLQDYRIYISTHENSGTAYTEFAIMQNFDNLLKARASFISFNEDMDYDFADKYEYKGPSVQHYTGFIRDESASITEQDSDLAKILLQVIPEVDDKGNIIQGSFIGLSGFNSAMLGLKKAILYSPASFSTDVRNSYFNGLNINMSKLIQEYINALLSKNNTLPAEHKTFLISKLRGIQKYIYDSRFEPIIKNMFTQMFFKTETVSYRAYSYDEDSRAIQARSLTSHFSDIQKLQLEDAIQGAAHLLRSNGTLKRKIKDKYRVQINNGVISLSDGGRNEVKIQVIDKNNKSSYKRISGEDHFVSQIISDVLFMTVPDTYVPVARQIDGKSDITILDDFATPLGIVLSNIFTNQVNSSSILDLKPYNTKLSDIGRKLSVIYGSETKNVVRNLSGSKIPLYQLTNMTYNTMSILDDCEKWAKEHPESENIYKDQLFIRYPGLLVAPQVRNEIRIGDQIKPSSKLTIKELVNISALEDFYKPLLQDGIIYLQNATFADKSTHYLIGYDLNAVKNGDKTLRGSLKDVVDGKSSRPLIEFIRKERARRINAIANNVIADYNKATARYEFVWRENSGSVNFTTLEQIDDFLQNALVYENEQLVPITEDILKEMFESAHIPLEEEVHYTKPKLKSRGKIRMNETFLNYHKTFNDPKLFEERINKSRRQFIENIKDIKWNKFDSGRFSEIFETYRQKLPSNWYDLNSGDIKLYNGDQLHPILEAYFLADILLSNEYNAVTIGEVWMHPNKNTNDTNVRTNKSSVSSNFVNHSGGADGADTYWGEVGEKYGVTSNHYYYGEKTPKGNLSISTEDYEEGKVEAAKAAARNWGYRYPTMKDNLIIRDWAQVKYADAIFAIGTIVNPGEKAFPNKKDDSRVAIAPMVTGGTGYAVGMAILHNKPVYVFDQKQEKWFTWDYRVNNFVETVTPTLTPNFAGIGSRTLTNAGKKAIEDVYTATFGPLNSQDVNFTYAQTSPNGYEVSSSGDSRFSARYATFKPGTILFGHDVGGRTIESVYQHGVKQNDWVTNNNNKTGAPTSNVIIKGNTEDDSYRDGYLPLWQEWANQNPELIEELREKVRGKVLTDKYASTRVSQARALADILNSTSEQIEDSTFDSNKEEGTYEEFSEANRLIAQIKRSVAFGATYHPFAQNQPNGVASEIDIAVISDMPANVFTPNGEEDTVDSMDGSGVADALQARFESNSLIDARVGDNKKTIMMDVDKKYGKPILLKWAVYALTNQYRRNGTGSFASAEELCRKMRSRQLTPGSGDQLVDLYNERVNSEKKIIFENNDTGERFRIESIEKQQDGTYRRQLIRIKNNGTTEGDAFLDETVFSLNTLYSMDQILGGAWTGEFREDGKWIYNEANNDILEELLTRNNSLKSGFIAYAVNKSAIKVGSGNVNDESVFNDDNAVLKTIKMRTKYGGVQMDADHELDEAEVTEMTQMISSLIEDQHYPELVKEIYTDIGNVVERHMRKYVKELSIINDESKSEEERKAAKDKLHQILGEALIAAFNTGTKDTLGLAQAFVQKASAAIAENKEFHIPFSSATINGQFISEVMASINRGGIRHKYEGLAGVLNPSFNMMQYYRVYNDETGKWEHRLYPQLAEYMRRRVGSGSVKAFQKNYEGFIDWNTENNPFVIDSISGRPITVNDIDFEDTVLITELLTGEDGQLYYGNTTQHYINSYIEYDKVKTLLRNNPNYQIRLHTGKGRNLRGADTRFTVGNTEYSYYDLDSVKASFYLNRIVKNIEDKPLRDILDEDQIDFLKTIYGETLETIDKATAQKYLKAQQTETQNVLKAIETGKEFYLLGHLVTASSWRTRPPEIIMGRYQMNKLGIDDTVHQYQINDSSFFKDNLNKKYDLPSNSNINRELYDVILYDGNKKFFVKIGKESDTASIYSKYSKVSKGNKNFTLNGESVWYNDDEVMDSNGIRFHTYIKENGEQFNLISVDSIEEYNKLLDSGIFDDFQSYNYQENNIDTLRKIRFDGKDEDRLWIEVDKNGIKRIVKRRLKSATLESFRRDEDFRRSIHINKKAKDLYEAYRNGKYFVGARIPTQAMQSFMPMECIAWADTDENIVYVPAMQTYLEGSDYDIDKLYILSFSIDDNGKLKTGSKLQNYFGLNVISNVGAPTGIEYSEGEGGTFVSEYELDSMVDNDMDDIEVIKLLKRIYTGGNIVTFEETSDQSEQGLKDYAYKKEEFLRIVNSHSKSTNDVRGYNLKNRIVSAIYNITTKPQNQLIAQVPINMDEPKAAAANSKLGKAELHINSDNPATKFMMQVQNMVGKQVIGISAVALKGFFAMSYAYSQRVQDVKNTIVSHASSQEVAKAFQRLLLINPLGDKNDNVTSVANIDIEQIIELLEDYPEYKQLTLDLRTDEINSVFTLFMEQCGDTYSLADESVTVDFERMLNVLQERVNRTDAALVISAIISAATDNAKELILAKINATPDLVDIYTYLTGIGVPFNKIADLMTSDALQFITQIGENNIFDSSTEKYRIKDTIGFYIGLDPEIFNNWQSLKKAAEQERKTVSKDQPHPYGDAWKKLNSQARERLMSLNGIEKDIIHCVFTKSKQGVGKPISSVELLAILEDSILIQSAINDLVWALGHSMSEDQRQFADAMHAEADYHNRKIIVFNENWKKSDIRNAIKFLEMTLERNRFRSANPNSIAQIKRLHKILPNVQVMSDFGNVLGINQGLKTNLFEFWKMRNKFRELMSSIPDLGVVNPSEMLPMIPHFWQMLQTLSSAENMIKRFSVKDRTVLEIMDTLKNEDVDYDYRVSIGTDKQFRSIVNYVNDLLIAAFLNDANLSVHISHDSGYIKPSGEKVFPKEGFNMRLNSLESIDTFKKWMDEYVIPQLLERYKGNAFIEALRPLVKIDSKTRAVDTGWKPALQMMDIDASPNTLQMYGEMLRGFDEIAGNDATLYGISIGDLLYLYNMILNKDGFGQNSFTRIFENLIQTSHGNLANKFNDYISRLDESDISLKWDSNEAKHRIKKDNPDINYIDGLAASNSILDLPVFFKEIVGSVLTDQEWIDKNKQETPKIRYRYTLTSEDLVLALVKDFNDKAKDSTVKINRISDLDLEQYKELPQYESMMKSKGFIYNGDIYINLDRFHDKSMYGAFETAIHEIAHIILANWKFKNPKEYYDLISRVRNHEKFNQIAANYEGVVGSDLVEEVFVNLLEMYLSDKQYLPFDAENDSDTKRVTEGFASNIESGVIEMVSDLLNLGEDTKLKREDIISADLNTLFDKFGYNVLHTSIPVDKAVIMDKQKQDTIKRQLWNDEKLTNSCDEK